VSARGPLLRRLAGAALLALALAIPARAADLAGWDETRWGMNGAELAHLYGKRATHLTGRIEFNHLYSNLVLKRASFAGLDFTVYFQMDERSGRLAQVLLERRRQYATPDAWHAVLDALGRAWGEPSARCGRGVGREAAHVGPAEPEQVWVLPTTTIRASYLDLPGPNFGDSIEMVRRIIVRYGPTRQGAAACP
jgi:hypothetical protein